MYRIMIVEDDEVIARAVQQSLVSWGMDAFCVQDFSSVLAEFAVKNPQLVLMDIHLPFFNGFHWCQEIRKVSKVPVIFLSSASDNMNIIMAVNMGGDDFIAKPFDLSVLTAKVQAMLRRTYEFAGETNFLEHRGAMLDTGSGVLNYRGKRIELTKNEWRILQSLLENKGKAVSRDMLMIRHALAEKTGGGRTYRLYPDEKGCRLPDRMTEAEQEKEDGTTERGNPAGGYTS